jgi:Rieske Fe-S protein
LAKLSEVPVGASRVIGVSGKRIALTRTAQDKVVGFSANCTHQGCELAAGDGALTCPCHQSRFDASTGQVTKGPATRPLDAIQVKVRGDAIYPG